MKQKVNIYALLSSVIGGQRQKHCLLLFFPLGLKSKIKRNTHMSFSFLGRKYYMNMRKGELSSTITGLILISLGVNKKKYFKKYAETKGKK